jgi:hypothetical protein
MGNKSNSPFEINNENKHTITLVIIEVNINRFIIPLMPPLNIIALIVNGITESKNGKTAICKMAT